MSSFSRVISRPTKEQLKPVALSKPTFATTQSGHSAWQPGYASQAPPQRMYQFARADLDPMFNPIWGSNIYKNRLWPNMSSPSMLAPRVAVPPNTARDLSPSPPLTLDEESAGSSVVASTSSSPELASPPATACSTTAVMGSAGLHHTFAFEDDYDRPEASPNFMRRQLRRSKSLRRQARMRDGDFRDTDNEKDYSVTTDKVPIVREEEPATRGLTAADLGEVGEEARTTTTPSRLSRRVKPPPPINTSFMRVAVAAKMLRNEIEVEVGRIDGSTFTSSSESGFEADDEEEDAQTAPKEIADKTLGGDAAIVASSPPRANTPESKALVPQVVHAQRVLYSKQQNAAAPFEWRPFVEPVDAYQT